MTYDEIAKKFKEFDDLIHTLYNQKLELTQERERDKSEIAGLKRTISLLDDTIRILNDENNALKARQSRTVGEILTAQQQDLRYKLDYIKSYVGEMSRNIIKEVEKI